MSLRSSILAILSGLPAPLAAKAWSDFVPDKTPLPYTALLIDISEVPILQGDGKTNAVERLGQVDLYEARATEDGTLRRVVYDALDGAAVEAMTRLRVRSVTRVPDPNFQIVHRAFTIAAVTRTSANPIPVPDPDPPPAPFILTFH